MKRPLLPLLLISCAAIALSLLGPARAEDPGRPKLVDHPMKDAKPGEYLRFFTANGKWKSWYIERVLDVREGEVLYEIQKTNDDGSKDLERVYAGWTKLVPLEPAKHQRIMEDEMEEMEIAGHKLWCRHFLVEERVDPDFPEPRRSKDVWYSNDVPCSGKVKDTQQNREIASWGMMPESELKARQEAWRKQEQEKEQGQQGVGGH